MDIIYFFKKLISRFAIGSMLGGGLLALTGLYIDVFNVSVIGFVLILVGILIMQIMFRKYGEF
jgi:hypothetical protein